MARHPDTARVHQVYERFAHRYDRGVRFWERVLKIEAGRYWICSRADGDVLEVGIGTGRNLPYYPPKGIRLTGVDLSPAMLEVAARRAAELRMKVDLHVGDAQALDFPDKRFDTVLFGLCLCSIPDEARAVAEGVRVLRPGGYVLLLEHVRSSWPLIRASQRLLEPLFLGLQADHLLRDPLERLRIEGLEVEEVHRWAWGVMERACAHKPA